VRLVDRNRGGGLRRCAEGVQDGERLREEAGLKRVQSVPSRVRQLLCKEPEGKEANARADREEGEVGSARLDASFRFKWRSRGDRSAVMKRLWIRGALWPAS
jgi:hypothetical protein